MSFSVLCKCCFPAFLCLAVRSLFERMIKIEPLKCCLKILNSNSNLFTNRELDDESLVFLINALCKLSKESMEIAYNNREPSLFAVVKLLETGLVNLFRYKIFWNQMTSHLLVVCQHPQIKMREWGTETLSTLVKTALQTADRINKHSIENAPKEESASEEDKIDEDKNVTFLRPLQSLSEIVFADIRQKQLDCILQILQTSGDTLVEGWVQILDIIGCIDKLPNESLLRLAFQCLQLIISDLLGQIPSDCLVLLVNTTEKFASQSQELNVSLTAIGLLWNIADFFHQNRDTIKADLKELKFDFSSLKIEKENLVLKPFDCLWMCLFSRLGDLCTDERPAIRKSASQTLFHTLGTHATILEAQCIWSAIVLEVLFPLLERVHSLSVNASTDKIVNASRSLGICGIGVSGGSNPLMLHHSRNTAYKQWSETQVLTLAGVSHVFSEKRHILLKSLDDFPAAWQLLLKHIEIPALSRNCEVSLNALNCFQEILHCNKQMVINSVKHEEETDEANSADETDSSQLEEHFRLELNSMPDSKTVDLWKMAWEVWHTIGTECFNRHAVTPNSPNPTRNKAKNEVDSKSVEQAAFASNDEYYAPSQAFLSSLIQIFPRLYENIKYDFNVDDFSKLSAVLENAVSVPIDLSTQAYLMSASVQTTGNFEYLVSQTAGQPTNNSSKQSGHQCSTTAVAAGGHTSNCSSLQQQQQYLISQTSQLVPLTPLQEAILCIMEMFQTDLFAQLSASLNGRSTAPPSSTHNSPSLSSGSDALKNAEELLTCLFSQLLTFATYACQPPTLNATNSTGNYPTSLGKSLLISSSTLLNKYQSSPSVSFFFRFILFTLLKRAAIFCIGLSFWLSFSL